MKSNQQSEGSRQIAEVEWVSSVAEVSGHHIATLVPTAADVSGPHIESAPAQRPFAYQGPRLAYPQRGRGASNAARTSVYCCAHDAVLHDPVCKLVKLCATGSAQRLCCLLACEVKMAGVKREPRDSFWPQKPWHAGTHCTARPGPVLGQMAGHRLWAG